jgi:GAF domain-containing protein
MAGRTAARSRAAVPTARKGLAAESARLAAELRGERERQQALAEILQAVNAAPGDLKPVFDTILDKATRLCDAPCGIFWVYDGDVFRQAAMHGLPEAFAEYLQQTNESPTLSLGAIRGVAPFVHDVDLAGGDTYRNRSTPLNAAVIELGRARTGLLVPLQKEGALLGAIHIYRHDVRPFTDQQIAVLRSFAAHAVVSIENARLVAELRDRTGDLEEALPQQTAIADVLKVISRSDFDLDAVLRTVITTAADLCGAQRAILYRYRDGAYHFAVGENVPEEYERLERAHAFVPGPGTVVGRAAQLLRPVQIIEPQLDSDYAWKEEVRLVGACTMLGVPLLRDRRPIGALALARGVIEPFTEKQIELVVTFADQAVIAIENAPCYRIAREPRPTDGDRRGLAGHQLLARRARPRVQRDALQGFDTVRCRVWMFMDLRRRTNARRCVTWRTA